MNKVRVFFVALSVSVFVLTGYGYATAQSVAQPVQPIADECKDAALKEHALHTGFQVATQACVDTEMGAVADQDKNPSLLIVDAPKKVKVNKEFTIQVSTRNLVRDRFLAAADGGFLVESALLNGAGLTRGHFHVACRNVEDAEVAPPPDRQTATFQAIEDSKGGATPDVVTVKMKPLTSEGEFACAAWAGDGSHRTPMMSFANQIPAFDVVRIEAR